MLMLCVCVHYRLSILPCSIITRVALSESIFRLEVSQGKMALWVLKKGFSFNRTRHLKKVVGVKFNETFNHLTQKCLEMSTVSKT